jgi:uncharacterized membrane protein YtjA (UPF0391 family)
LQGVFGNQDAALHARPSRKSSGQIHFIRNWHAVRSSLLGNVIIVALIKRKFEERRKEMLRLALLFLVIALVAAALGFGGVAILSLEGARLMFLIFLVLAVLSLVFGIAHGRPPQDLL